ncbi:hypothetical protein [Methanobacterium subterraneum]|jgi:uncharacterized membrane protein HdeD (DUF308 family)|nr:hypothetical protein [Methanobacterium subterraneum]
MHPLIVILIGLAIIFIITYLVGFIIVKLKKVKKSNLMIVIGFIALIYGLISLLFFNEEQQILTCLVGISFIIDGIFRNRGYYNKTYYLSSLALLIMFGVIIIYEAFFKHNYFGNIYFIYSVNGMIIVGIIILVRSYLRRHENQKIPWKNEW